MIYARPGANFPAELDGAPQSLGGTLQVGIFLEPAGTAVVAYTTAGVSEEVSGASTSSYYKVLTAPSTAPADGTKYVVKWKNGSTIVTEDLALSGVLTQLLAPSGPNVGIAFGDLVAAYLEMMPGTPLRAKARINQAYRRFAAKSEGIRARISLGATVIGQDTYELDNAVIGLYSLKVDNKPFQRKGIDELDELAATDGAYVVGRYRGFFAPEYDAAGGGQFRIYGVPTVADLAISGRASLYPADMVEDAEYPLLPPHFHDALTDGAFAIGLGRDDERFADRQSLLAEFDAAAAECRSQLNRRVGSGGVARVRLTR